ncbi:MAG TPA: NfeD family protein [Candidatus Acidoferrum sp.]|nr:NfeD family protein [Candidatus Acidoferrum sp.]
MTWSDFYLFCFLVGFSLSVLSFVSGALHLHVHLPFKWHLPFHGGHQVGHNSGLKGSAQLSWLNASTLLAFLAWFGGTGYLLTRHSRLVGLLILAVSTLAGLMAGWSVFRFMFKLVSSEDLPMTNEERRIEGAIGTVSMPIREGGTGEIIFPIGGVRRCAGARAEDGKTIEKGAEVVIERYEKGIAYVKRWEEFTS